MMKMKVKRVNMGKKFYGMNYYANKELKTGFKLKPNEILIDKNLKGRMKVRTIAHEKIECSLMKRGLSYKKADRIAMKWEKMAGKKIKRK